jgi:hypothetical protein
MMFGSQDVLNKEGENSHHKPESLSAALAAVPHVWAHHVCCMRAMHEYMAGSASVMNALFGSHSLLSYFAHMNT